MFSLTYLMSHCDNAVSTNKNENFDPNIGSSVMNPTIVTRRERFLKIEI